MIEELVNKNLNIKWFYEQETNEYIVIAHVFNREVYRKRLDRKHYEIYHYYINERINYLLGEGILNKEYDMILIDNTMYRVLDHFHFMELSRFITPVDSHEGYEFKENIFDLVLDATIRTGEIFDETDLVYHNGNFYNKGINIGSIKDFDRDGIEYEPYDLLNGLTEEQIDYLFYKMYYMLDCTRVKNYVTKNVNIKIDR